MKDLNGTKMVFRPFLKWAGGKTKLLEQYKNFIPRQFETYYEPFLGGGAVFFYLAVRSDTPAVLTDINPHLIEVYQCVKSKVELLIEGLEEHQRRHDLNDSKDKHYYYDVRSSSYDNDIDRAARLIYLNRTCFNGLYRENSNGEFNVPLGDYKNPKICQPELLRSASKALQKAEIEVRDFEKVLNHAKSGDFVYFDPPYHPLNSTSYFTAYSRESFSEDDQKRLKETFVKLAKKGVKVMLSNSDCEFIENLYKDQGFEIHKISAPRTINSNTKKRGRIGELLITSYSKDCC